MKLLFWQNIISPHQSGFLRALANAGHEVTVVASEVMSPERQAMGWQAPDLGSARVIIAPTERQVRELIDGRDKLAVHVIAGARWTPLGNLATRLCWEGGCRMGIITEAPDHRGFMGRGRWLKYTIERFATGFRYDFVLAMGEVGIRWFRSCGFSDDKIFVFAYVAEPDLLPLPTDTSAELVFLFAGRLIALKGVDMMLRAFAAGAGGRARLNLLGDGPEKERLERLVLNLALQNRVVWLPKANPAGVHREMQKADVTLLPSHKDGWGVVVNESLMAGTPVICSSACGASELIRHPWLGSVFRAGKVEELAGAIKTWTDLGLRTPAERERIREWSVCIRGETVANYFTAVMDHVYEETPRPVAPWRNGSGSEVLQFFSIGN